MTIDPAEAELLDVELQTHRSHLTLMGLPGEGPRYDALRKRIEVLDDH